MTIQQSYQQLLAALFEVYDDREAANIANWVIEHITGFTRSQRIINKTFPLSTLQQEQLQHYISELLQHRPVQYVLGETWFAGLKLFVDENVLIPRPETEELVEWIAADLKSEKDGDGFSVLDIGTGSGCIPIAIKNKLAAATVFALDLSAAALEVAKRNAAMNQTPINFFETNFLKESEWNALPAIDIIVSNPPYIKQREEANMKPNVLQFEPHVALFVPGEDALLFYQKIALFGQTHLTKNGKIYVEINEALGEEVKQLFAQNGYVNIKVRKDLQGKDRMVKAERTH